MTKKRVAAAVVAPELAVPAAVAEQASGVGGAIVKAATTPFITRTRRERWDPESEQWVPDTRELGVNVTPVGVLVGGLLTLGAAAALQRGVRTGTLQAHPEVQWANPAGKRVWVPEDNPAALDPAKGPWVATGKKRRRPVIRYRDNVADYQPFARI